MPHYGLLAFCAVYALSVAAPGPGVAALLARSLAHGTRGMPAFIAGYLLGDLTWFTFAATGLAALAEHAHMAFLVVKYLGVAYLLYLAFRMWTAPVRPLAASVVESSEKPARLMLGSLSLTLGNPKPMVFFLALLPTVIRLETLTLRSYLEVAALIAVILPLVLGAYVLAAARARRLFRGARAVRILNRSTSVAMASAAVAVAAR